MDKQTFLSSYEKDGYQVIDSFIYDDIKTFLDQNPDLNKKLHDLNLDSAYYGQLEKQNIANNTNTQANVTQ